MTIVQLMSFPGLACFLLLSLEASGNLWHPPVGTQKQLAHISDFNRTLITSYNVCFCPCSSPPVSSLNGKGNASFISHFPVAWHINGHWSMCLKEGESRWNVLQKGLCFSALCLACSPLWSHPSWAGSASFFPTAQLATWCYFNFNSVEKESDTQIKRKKLATNFSKYFILDP